MNGAPLRIQLTDTAELLEAKLRAIEDSKGVLGTLDFGKVRAEAKLLAGQSLIGSTNLLDICHVDFKHEIT